MLLRLSLPKPQITSYHSFPNQTHMASLIPSPSSLGIRSLSGFEKVAVLGHGNGGIAYKVHHKKNNCLYALKVLRRSFSLYCKVPCNSNKKVIFCHTLQTKSVAPDLSFVMEYMKGGSLHEILQHHRLRELQFLFLLLIPNNYH